MKTLFKSLLVAFTLTFVSTTASFATTTQPTTDKVAAYQSSLYTDVQGRLRIAIDKQTGGVVDVRIVNSQGKEFFVQQVGKRQQKARLSLDISNLPDGAYEVAISNGVDTKANRVTLVTQQPHLATRLIAVK